MLPSPNYYYRQEPACSRFLWRNLLIRRVRLYRWHSKRACFMTRGACKRVTYIMDALPKLHNPFFSPSPRTHSLPSSFSLRPTLAPSYTRCVVREEWSSHPVNVFVNLRLPLDTGIFLRPLSRHVLGIVEAFFFSFFTVPLSTPHLVVAHHDADVSFFLNC